MTRMIAAGTDEGDARRRPAALRGFRRRLEAVGLAMAIWVLASISSPLPSQAQPASGAPGGAADIAFWNSVKDTKSPAELKAYLDAFPAGTFAALARLRLQKLSSTTPPPPPSPRRPLATDAPLGPPPEPGYNPVLLDVGSIRDVQKWLRKLGFKVSRSDGMLDATTRDAIRSWQRRSGLPPTGQITETEYRRMKRAAQGR